MYSAVLQRVRQKVRAGIYHLTQHAIEEMNHDDFFVEDMEHGIFSGKITERQKDLVTGEWKYVIIGYSTQKHKQIGVVLKEKHNVIIVTVFWKVSK